MPSFFPRFYILNEQHDLIVCKDLLAWARWRENKDNCRVAETFVGDARVSTVFIGIDPGVMFETMIFGGPHDEYQDRCDTWEQALAMHAEAVALAGADEITAAAGVSK